MEAIASRLEAMATSNKKLLLVAIETIEAFEVRTETLLCRRQEGRVVPSEKVLGSLGDGDQRRLRPSTLESFGHLPHCSALQN